MQGKPIHEARVADIWQGGEPTPNDQAYEAGLRLAPCDKVLDSILCSSLGLTIPHVVRFEHR